MKTTYIIDGQVKGKQKIDGLQKSLKGVSSQTNKAAAAFSKLKTAGNSLMGVLGSLGATAAVSGFLKAGIDMQRTSKTLKVLTSEFNEHQQVLDFVNVAADRFGLSQQRASKGVSDLFARLRPMGINLEQIKDVYLGINNAALRYNLSAADTEGVMLQLSQALGSGVLQGDEFRSVMERLPAVGQAIAETMGVTVGELKQLSSDGMLTTDKIIEAMAKLRNAEAPKPDAFKLYRKAMENLSTTIGTKLLPAFTPLIETLNKVLTWFNKLPGPVQTIIAGITALGAGIVIIAPALGVLSAAFGGIVTVLGVLSAPLLAVPIGIAAISAAAIALGVVLFKFRKNIAAGFMKLGEFLIAPFKLWVNWVKFNVQLVLGPINAIWNAAKRAAKVLAALFRKRRSQRNQRNQSSNQERAAEGLYASNPTDALVGEAGGEYVIPSRKAGAFARNYMGGLRGSAAIPRRFAEGGFVPGNANISITTGPVTQMDGQNFVTTQDMARAVQTGVNQTLSMLSGDMDLRQQLGLT